jgi:glycosyltransferase involved in cell wall biosynthesis
MSSPPVTVILPTHDHAATLGYAIASVLEQTFPDLGLVVIGDGVGDDTRDVVADAQRSDVRVTFLDRPKAPRHAEQVRHEVISQVDSRVIAYHGDDDLLLPHHLEAMLDLLGDADFVHPLPIFVVGDRSLRYLPADLSRPDCIAWHLGEPIRNAVSLTGVAHSRDSYTRLPHGWRETPDGLPTDHYMWQQYFSVADLRAVTSPSATTIKLPNALRQQMDVPGRAGEIESWWHRIHEADFHVEWQAAVEVAIRRAALDAVLVLGATEDHLTAAQHEIAQLRSAADSSAIEAQERIGRALVDRDAVRQELEELYGSRSWRLTRPLRTAALAWRNRRP